MQYQKKMLLGPCIALLFGAGTALAEVHNEDAHWYLGAGATTTTPVLRPDNGISAGGVAPRLLAGRQFGSHWALEMAYLDIGTEAGLYRPCPGQICPAVPRDLVVDSAALSLGMRYQWRLGDWLPFVKLGVHRTSSAIDSVGSGDYNGTFVSGRSRHIEQLGAYGEIGLGYAIASQWQVRLSGEWYEFESRSSGNAGVAVLFGF